MTEPLIGGGFIVDWTILSQKQKDLLATLRKSNLLSKEFYLAEGTGLALQLSHRESKESVSWNKIRSDFITLSREYMNQHLL